MFPIVQDHAGALDPVCGMRVHPEHAAGTATYRGESFYFCSAGCLARFENNPEKVLHPAQGPAPKDVEYTCPMHPEVRQVGPGSCPKCGMALATPVVVWGGWPIFERGWASIRARSLNMFTLISLGAGTAYAYSVVATLAPGIFPSSFREHDMVAVYFEPAAVIVALVLLGQVLELRARSQTSSAIKALLGLAPKTARVIHGDVEE